MLSGIGILASISLHQCNRSGNAEPEPLFSALWSCCVRQTNLPLSTTTSSPNRAMSYGSACSATFTAHMESLFFTAGQLFPLSFMKCYRILKTTRRSPQPSTGALHRLGQREQRQQVHFRVQRWGQGLCFSHRQLYSVFPHKDSCLSITSDGEKGSWEVALENMGPHSSCLRAKGPDASAFLVGVQLIHPVAVRTCGFQQWTVSIQEFEWIKSPNAWLIWGKP